MDNKYIDDKEQSGGRYPNYPHYPKGHYSGGYENQGEESHPSFSFDIFGLITKLLRYWYWIIIGLIIGIGIAYLWNRRWEPIYNTQAKVYYEDNKSKKIDEAYLSGFSSGVGTNLASQTYLFKSYDLINRTLDKMSLDVSVFREGVFRKVYFYKDEPVLIHIDSISSISTGVLFRFDELSENGFKIKIEKGGSRYEVTGVYGKRLATPYFIATFLKREFPLTEPFFFFQFNSRDHWINHYSQAIKIAPIAEATTILNLSMDGKVPAQDIDFLEKLIQQFIHEDIERKNISADRTIDFIDAQLAIISDSLKTSERSLMNYQKANNLYNTEVLSKPSMALNQYDDQRSQLRLKRAYFSYLEKYLSNNLSTQTVLVPASMGVTDNSLQSYTENYNTLLLKHNELSDKNPIKGKVANQIKELKEVLKQVVQALKDGLKLEDEQLTLLEETALKAAPKMLDKGREFTILERDFKLNDTYFSYLSQKKAEAQIQKASNASDYYLLETPRIISVINSGDKLNKYLIFIALGFFIPILIIVLVEILDFSVRSRIEVEKTSPYPYVGSIINSFKEDVFVFDKFPRSSFTESIRAIRTRLLRFDKSEKLSFLVTSAEPGDGKSFVSINFASSLKALGKKVVLVDYDLRKPSISKKVGIASQTGLSSYLAGKSTLDEIILKNEEWGFDIIPSGKIPVNPGEMVRRDRSGQLIGLLKERYDYIVIDSSPVGLVTDSLALYTQVDMMLFLVKQSKTNRNFFRSVIKQLYNDRLENVFVAMNGTHHLSEYKYYGGKMYAYEYYGKGEQFHDDYFTEK